MRLTTIALAAIGVVAAALFGGYAVYWHRLAADVPRGVEAWAAQQRRRGYSATHGEITVNGFPGELRVAIQTPVLARPTGNPSWRWSGPTLHGTWSPWNPKRILVDLAGEHRLDVLRDQKPRGFDGTAENAVVEVTLGERGRVDESQLRAGGLVLERAGKGERVVIERLNASARLADGNPRPSYDVSISAKNLALPPSRDNPLGPDVARLTGDFTTSGPLPLDGTAAAAAAWRDAGGHVVIKNLELDWGPMWLKSKGTVRLDTGLQLNATLNSQLRGWTGLFEALVAMDRMSKAEALIANLALGALARSPAGGGAPVLPVPLRLADTQVFLGPVKLLKLRPLKWR